MKRYNLGSQLAYDNEGNMISQGVLHEHPFGRLIYFHDMIEVIEQYDDVIARLLEKNWGRDV